MDAMEIVLIILGIIVFALSFLLPAGKKDDTGDNARLNEDAIREMVNREVDDARSRINDIVDETISYAMEKSERSMDRITNEKMMAVNEYSDTVLEEINKNHKEVVFLYDMLNDKHENLKTTVSEAVRTAGEIKQTMEKVEITAREVQETVNEAVNSAPEPKEEFKPISPVRVEITETLPVEEKKEEPAQTQVQEEKGKEAELPKKTTKKPRKTKAANRENPPAEASGVEVSLNAAEKRNNNDRILELHKAGKSNMAIARELGLGIGEVKLVIDLFEGI